MSSNSDNSAFAKAETPQTPYSVSEGQPPFDWNKFLDKEDRTEAEWFEAKSLAGWWVTCACGNQCSSIPRSVFGQPLDDELIILGCSFTSAISNKDIVKANEVLKAIEKRSSFLLAEIHNSKTADS